MKSRASTTLPRAGRCRGLGGAAAEMPCRTRVGEGDGMALTKEPGRNPLDKALRENEGVITRAQTSHADPGESPGLRGWCWCSWCQ